MPAEPTTSKLRQAACAACTATAMANSTAAILLRQELERRDYSERTDGELVELMELVGVNPAKITEIALLDQGRYPDHEGLHLCPDCQDNLSVPDPDHPGRFVRCPRCNPEPVIDLDDDD